MRNAASVLIAVVVTVWPALASFGRVEPAEIGRRPPTTGAPRGGGSDDWRIFLRSGTIEPASVAGGQAYEAPPLTEPLHVLIQFESIPTDAERQALSSAGVHLHRYVPRYAYWATLAPVAGLGRAGAVATRVRWTLQSSMVAKVSPSLLRGEIPSHARLPDGTIDAWVTCFPDVDRQTAEHGILAVGARVLGWLDEHLVRVAVAPAGLSGLNQLDEVEWVESAPPPTIPDNAVASRRIHVDAIRTAAYGLAGTGVTVGVWDSGRVFAHIDFGARLTVVDTLAAVSDHSTHVAGTVAGDGTGHALATGMAPGASLHAYDWSNDTAEMRAAAGTVHISNHSYGSLAGCYQTGTSWSDLGSVWFGLYESKSSAWDSVVFDTGLIVFKSAGNDRGEGPCGSPAHYDGPYDSIPTYATSKNVVTIGATDASDQMTGFSGWGPTDDGRIKPDLVADGVGLYSTLPNHGYGTYSGTSMSTPGAAGAAALLVELYRARTLTTPSPATIKALLIHGATDLGRPGPDYEHGWGLIDAQRSAALVIDGRWHAATYAGTPRVYPVTVPSGTPHLVATLVWTDPPGSPSVVPTLQNDLDLVIRAPDGSVYDAWVLDPSAPTAPATRGHNRVDNVEQVVVPAPSPGVWTIEVGGTVRVRSSQAYTIVCDLLGQTISGRVHRADGSGVVGVTMTGLPGNPTTDAAGAYLARVPFAWSGRVTPTSAGGLVFIPAFEDYAAVSSDRTTDYLGGAPVAISGQVRTASGVGVAEVWLTGLPDTLAWPSDARTDTSGRYAVVVPSGWSGTATPSKAGHAFMPPTTDYGPVTTPRVTDYAATYRRYFAEGAVTAFFDCLFALVNPSATGTATVRLRFLRDDTGVYTATVLVPPLARRTVDARQVAGLAPSTGFATIIDSDVEVVAERTMRWDATSFGSHTERAIVDPADTWYVAEGATHSGFHLYYLVANPNLDPVDVRITYVLPSPAASFDVVHPGIPAQSRVTVPVDADDPRLSATDVSAIISSLTPGRPIVVERAMYLDRSDRAFIGGSVGAGVSTPSSDWFMAEGATLAGFDMYLLLMNPGARATTATVTCSLADGRTAERTYVLEARSRRTLWMNAESGEGSPDTTLAGTTMWVAVHAADPIVVERSMWWPAGGASRWQEGHSAAGSVATGVAWALADCAEGGQEHAQTYVTVANASDTTGRVKVTLLFEDGRNTSDEMRVAPHGRVTVWTGATEPDGSGAPRFGRLTAGRRFGVLVESLESNGRTADLIVERSTYADAGGVRWAAGSSVTATRLR